MDVMSDICSPLNIGSKPEIIRSGITKTHRAGDTSFTLDDRWGILFFHDSFDVSFAGRKVTLKPGYIALFPPGMEKTYHFTKSFPVYYVIHFKLASKNKRVENIPAIIDADEEFELFDRLFLEIIEFTVTDRQRAEICLWNILYKLLDANPVKKKAVHRQNPVLTAAIREIEMNISAKITVGEVAEHCGVSHNHLTNIFKKTLGITVIGYIHKKRMERISYLLLYTNQPIKQVAYECGIPDLHLFNKSVKKFFGHSPRKYRALNSKIT